MRCLRDNLMIVFSRDVDPDWLYPDPDPKNLMNLDPDPGQYNHQIDLRVKKINFHVWT